MSENYLDKINRPLIGCTLLAHMGRGNVLGHKAAVDTNNKPYNEVTMSKSAQKTLQKGNIVDVTTNNTPSNLTTR